MINRSNYEIWFIDYYDGTLLPQQVADLFLFLETNLDLKQAFETFENIHLDAERVNFTNKAELKRPQITSANFNEYAVAYLEGDLTVDDVTVYLNFIQNNVSFHEQHLLFAKTKLQAAEKIIFPSKELLKRRVSSRVITMSFVRYAVAASVILVLGYFFVGRDDSSELNNVAIIENNNKINNNSDRAINPETKNNTSFVEENKLGTTVLTPLNKAALKNKNPSTSQVAAVIPPLKTTKDTTTKNALSVSPIKKLAEAQIPVVDLLLPLPTNNIAFAPVIIEALPLSFIDDSYAMVMQNLVLKNKNKSPLLEMPEKVKEEAIERVNSYAVQEDLVAQQPSVDKEKLKWLAVVGKVINKITFKKVNIETTYSPQGDLMAYQVTAGKLNFERLRSK